MGTQYTDDGGLGDFIVGQATGVGYNFHSSLGAQCHQPYTPPAPYIPPKGRDSSAQTVIAPAAPVQPLTPEQVAALKRRSANRAAYARRAPFFKRITGKVVSWLGEDGAVLANADGDLEAGEIVPRREHLRRLDTAYKKFWEHRLETFTDNDDEDAFHYRRDAEERLLLLKRGRYLSPVNRNAIKMEADLFKKRRRIFRTKVVRRPVWKVGLREYDRRFLLYADKVFSGHSFLNWKADGKQIGFLSAKRIFEFYLKWPYTITKPE
ncbi:hypothetical protein HPQ64_12480 [Rhizobiales bacterium]|uniref:hypothetical protein n=1 Tax=Hongsoonwoonella zoysiae TaxID=2821844 RepID=UPI0015614C94|nr:hypothetical protein [Hongsoonwoonella zoysiae]NRG18505.1 hypothetical protein [Hongsoonwoonella zoysiae]